MVEIFFMKWNTFTEQLQLLILQSYIVLLIINQCKSRDVLPQSELYLPDYQIYHNLTKIKYDIQTLSRNNEKYIKVDWNYTSRKGLLQPVIHITNFNNSSYMNSKKVKILLSYGEHARELLPIESMFFLLRNITNSLSLALDNPDRRFVQLLVTHIDLYISVIVNPDGRNYIEKRKNYCWRGTSTGVDLNRNFDWNFGGVGSSKHPNDEEYRGSHPFSEPECRVLTDLTKQEKFDAFLSFHSGIQQIYVPFADTASKKLKRSPENLNGMLDLARQLSTSTEEKFSYGLAHKLNEYTADGTIFDYMAGKRKIPFSLAVELWGNTNNDNVKCFDLFNPQSEKLMEVLQKLHPFYEVLFVYLINWKNNYQAQDINLQVPVPIIQEVAQIEVKYYFVAVAVMFLAVLVIHFHRLNLPCTRMYHKRRIVNLRALGSTFSFTSVVKTS